MPTYQYACTACNHRFEAVQSFSDASLTDCPECTGGLRKVFSSVGIVFKGSGFYRNDSREKATSGASDSSKSESSTSGAKADLKPDATPAKAGSAAAKSTATTSTDSSGGSAGSAGASKPSRSSTEGSAA